MLIFPTQLSFHFWPGWSYVIGRRIDYLSPTIYLTDILIFTILIFYLLNKNHKPLARLNTQSVLGGLIIILLIILNINYSSQKYLTIYKWLRVCEFSLFSFYILKNINIKKEWDNIVKVLSIGVVFESIIAISQFINQTSLNGIFYWIGERTFTASTPNIAKANVNNILIMRPYATFPHPNTLAGYFAAILPLILITDFKPGKIKWLSFVLGFTALTLTFSRPAIILGVFGIIICWLFENYHKKIKTPHAVILTTLLFITIFTPVLYFLSHVDLEKESIARRISLNKTAIEMFKNKPLYGVGLGNFIPETLDYSKDKESIRFLQPAHNIYLLILSETGLVGLSLFLVIIFISIKKLLNRLNLTKFLTLNSLFTILALGLIDHYFITLQQTQILFTIIVSLALIKYQHEI